MRIPTLALIAAAGIGVGPTDSAREETPSHDLPFCAWMFEDDCDFGDHKLQGPAPDGYDGSQAHGDCRTCLVIGPCHSPCEAEDDEESVRAAYAAAVVAASRGDVRTVLNLERAAGRYVKTNRERRSVQVMSCDGSAVIANLPI